LKDFTVKEKREKSILAAALKFDPFRDIATRVKAKGRGLIAEKIISLAKKHNIPIKDDPALVEVLMRLDVDETIPTELYQAVAEILAFVYNLNRKRKEEIS